MTYQNFRDVFHLKFLVFKNVVKFVGIKNMVTALTVVFAQRILHLIICGARSTLHDSGIISDFFTRRK